MTINGSTNASNWTFKLEAYEIGSYSITDNTSTVRVDMYLGRANSQSYLGGDWNGSITVDGQTQYLSGNIPYPTYVNAGAWLYLGTKDYTVGHNTDGSKVAGVSASFSSGDFTPSSAWASGDLTLTTIPRASSVTATNADIGSATSININRASSSFTHTLKYTFGSLSDTIVSKTSETSYGWTVPTTFYAQIPNAKTGTCTITCETYNGNTLIGTKTTTFTVTANETLCKPTITGSVVDSNQTTINLTGDNAKLIKYYSNAQITFSRSAKNSATIASTRINNVSVSSSPYTINRITTNQITITVTDSRGYSNTLTLTPTMINYIPLTAQVSFFRTEPTTGRVSLNFSGNYFNGSFGNQNNTLTLNWYYKEKSASSWTTGGTLVQNTDYVISDNSFHSGSSSYTDDIIIGSNFDYQKAYEFKFEFIDKLVSSNITSSVSKGQPALWWNDDKVDIVNKLILDKYVGDTLFVEDIQSKNMLNINNITYSYGGTITVSNNSVSIPWSGGATGEAEFNIIKNKYSSYTLSYNTNTSMSRYAIKCLDSSGNIISNISLSGYTYNDAYKGYMKSFTNTSSVEDTFELPNTVSSFKIIFINNNSAGQSTMTYSNAQLEKDTVATDYVEHKEYINQDIYSTNEIKIGIWIDGKTLYRKVFTSILTNAGARQISSGLTNENICRMYGVAREESTGYTIPIPHVNISSVSNGIRVDYVKSSHTLNISSGSNFSAYTAYVVLEYTKN